MTNFCKFYQIICIYQNNFVILHRLSKKLGSDNQKVNKINNEKMNKHYYTKSLGNILLDVTTINRNFRIKVHGLVNGQKWNKLVGVAGLLALLNNDWNRLVKMVLRAFNSLTDKCACKIYGGATVTFYAK